MTEKSQSVATKASEPDDRKRPLGSDVSGEQKDKKEKVRTKTFPWMHPAIKPKSKPGFGMGLFCDEFIPEGTVVWRDSDESMEALRYTREQIEAFPEDEAEDFRIHAYQVDELMFSGTLIKKGDPDPVRDPSEYKNHSCDPNVWHEIDCDTVMTARKDINPGDEVTYDYCTTETENSMHVAARWTCKCGAKECRGKLTGVEYQDPALQKRYEHRWAEYIQKKIDAYNAKSESAKKATTTTPAPVSVGSGS